MILFVFHLLLSYSFDIVYLYFYIFSSFLLFFFSIRAIFDSSWTNLRYFCFIKLFQDIFSQRGRVNSEEGTSALHHFHLRWSFGVFSWSLASLTQIGVSLMSGATFGSWRLFFWCFWCLRNFLSICSPIQFFENDGLYAFDVPEYFLEVVLCYLGFGIGFPFTIWAGRTFFLVFHEDAIILQ